MAQERKDIITDDALAAPLVMAENLKVEHDWLLKVSKAGEQANKAVDQSESTKKLKDDISKLTSEQIKLLKVQTEIAAVSERTLAANKKEVAALDKARVSYAALRTEEERRSKAGQELIKIMEQEAAKLKLAEEEAKKFSLTMGGIKQELKEARNNMIAIAATLGEDSEEFKAAALAAGELQDKLGDISDASKVVSGDTAFEKMGAQASLLTDKLKNLDFKGAATQVKGLSTTISGMSFKQMTEGIGGVGKAFLGLGKALLANPLFLAAAVIIGVGLAINALKDKLFPLIKLFDLIGNAWDFVVQKAKDFSDAMGLSAFAAEDNAKRIIAASEKTQKKLADKYDDEIELAKASGQNTLQLELAKQRMYEDTAEKALDAMRKTLKEGGKIEQAKWDEQYKIQQKAIQAQKLIRIDYENWIKDIQAQALAEVKRQRDEAAKLEQQRIGQQIKVQDEIAKTEGKSYEQRIAASVKAEQKRIDLINSIKKQELSKLNEGDIYQEAAAREKAEKAIQEVKTQSAEFQRNLLIKMLQDEKAIYEEMAQNQKATYDQRIEAVNDAMEKEVDILTEKLHGQIITQKQFDKAMEDEFVKATDRIVALQIERQQKLADAAITKADTGKNKALEALEKEFAEGNKTYKDYLKEREDIQKNHEANAMQYSLDALNEEIEMRKKNHEDTTDLENQASATSLKIAEKANALLIEGEEKKGELLKELAVVAYEGALEMIDNFNEAADMRREEESQRIADNLENDLMLVGDNLEAQTALKNQAAVAQDKIRKEQAAADRKRAIFEKAQAVIGIIIDTARGVAASLKFGPPAGFILAAITAAIGAVQLGVVLSKPIPSYAKGTKGHKGGWARVGEEGSELIIEPSGRRYLSPDKESFLNLPAQTKVIPHSETINQLARNAVGRLDSMRGTAEDASNRKLERKLDTLNHTMRNKKEVLINYTKAGAEAMFRQADSKHKYLNEFYR